MGLTEIRPVALPALTGLRFFAAFAIVFHHLSITIFKFDPQESFFLQHYMSIAGSLGMTLFFVLSGFIIHYNYFYKIRSFSLPSIYNFFVARVARLYPLFLFFLLFDLFGYVLSDKNVHTISEVIPYFLTLTQSWSYHLIGNQTVTYSMKYANITWSISTEFFLYICYPAIAVVLSRISRTRHALIALAIFSTASWAFFYLLNSSEAAINRYAVDHYGFFADTANNQYSFWEWLAFISPLVRLPEFILGSLTAHLLLGLQGKEPSRKEGTAGRYFLLVAFCGIGVLCIPSYSEYESLKVIAQALRFYLCAAIIIFYCSRYKTTFVNFLSNKTLVSLGDASYSLYLFHLILLSAVAVSVPVPLSAQSFAFLSVRAVLAVSAIFLLSYGGYHLIEVPARKWVREVLSVKALPVESHPARIASRPAE